MGFRHYSSSVYFRNPQFVFKQIGASALSRNMKVTGK